MLAEAEARALRRAADHAEQEWLNGRPCAEIKAAILALIPPQPAGDASDAV